MSEPEVEVSAYELVDLVNCVSLPFLTRRSKGTHMNRQKFADAMAWAAARAFLHPEGLLPGDYIKNASRSLFDSMQSKPDFMAVERMSMVETRIVDTVTGTGFLSHIDKDVLKNDKQKTYDLGQYQVSFLQAIVLKKRGYDPTAVRFVWIPASSMNPIVEILNNCLAIVSALYYNIEHSSFAVIPLSATKKGTRMYPPMALSVDGRNRRPIMGEDQIISLIGQDLRERIHVAAATFAEASQRFVGSSRTPPKCSSCIMSEVCDLENSYTVQ